MIPRLYTLDDAKRRIALNECVAFGCEWQIIEQYGLGPVLLLCERCGAERAVVQPNEST